MRTEDRVFRRDIVTTVQRRQYLTLDELFEFVREFEGLDIKLTINMEMLWVEFENGSKVGNWEPAI